MKKVEKVVDKLDMFGYNNSCVTGKQLERHKTKYLRGVAQLG